MKEYTFDDCDIGTTETFEIKVTESMMADFLEVSGDENPMHIDGEYAKAHGYNGRLVYGLLTSAFYSKLVGMYLPGKYCILKSIEVFFERPVYIGDVLSITGRVKEKDERFSQISVKANIKNQQGKIVSKADILVGFYE